MRFERGSLRVIMWPQRSFPMLTRFKTFLSDLAGAGAPARNPYGPAPAARR